MNASVKPGKLIKGQTGDWEVVIGMEIHAQVTSNSKLFSGASTEFGGEPNSHVSLVDAAMPGSPAMFTVTVKMSLRYISTGSAPFSPTPNAADGVAGVRIALTPLAKQSSKSFLISVRTFCARR